MRYQLHIGPAVFHLIQVAMSQEAKPDPREALYLYCPGIRRFAGDGTDSVEIVVQWLWGPGRWMLLKRGDSYPEWFYEDGTSGLRL